MNATTSSTDLDALAGGPDFQPVLLPAGWYPDPLDQRLQRYHDGAQWTFRTAGPAAVITPRRERGAPGTAGAHPDEWQPNAAASTSDAKIIPPPASTGLRPDIQAAAHSASGLFGAKKEISLLESRLDPEERILVLCPAAGDGFGVLACTNRRLLFLFEGLVRRQFLEVDWNQARHVVYDRTTKRFNIYTGRITRRAVPALSVVVSDRNDAVRMADAAEQASAAPRLDIL